jgi:ATP-dependent RNA helicase DDX5/DBP2
LLRHTVKEKGVDLIPLEMGKMMTKTSLLKRHVGDKTQNGVYSAANGSFGNNFVSDGIQTILGTVNPTGSYQDSYDSTQQYGSNVASIHNGMNQQA